MEAHPVPYVPFRTFLAALETLERGCPNQLDRSVWPSSSGAIQGQLLGAFRFLGLMDEAQCPSAELRELIGKKESRRALLRRILEKNYATLVALDLSRTSPHQLEEAMRQYGLSGATHKKALSFFLQAAHYAGLPLSVLLRAKIRGSGGGPRQRRAPATEAATAIAAGKTVHLKSGGSVTLTTALDLFSLSAEDRKFVFELIDRMQEYGG
ncbi:MAG: hypothetical protein ACLQGV_02740 [Bryobacteraceae bacterium]